MTTKDELDKVLAKRAHLRELQESAARDERMLVVQEQTLRRKLAEETPVNRSNVQLTTGQPVPADRSHTEDRGDGQQKGYIVLSPEERAKGFVRPVRMSYRHVGAPGPRYSLRDLTPDEHEQFDRFGYIKYEAYPVGSPENAEGPSGMFWTQARLDGVANGCRKVTHMSRDLAETYARDPKFYGGTFCATCSKHFPVGAHGEFVWEGTSERVGT